MSNVHRRSSRCLSVVHASPAGKPLVRSSLLHLGALVAGRREWGGPGRAAAGWPTRPRGGCAANARQPAEQPQPISRTLTPFTRGSSPCKWCGSQNSQVCQEPRKMKKKSDQSWKKSREGAGCPLPALLCHRREPGCQFTSKCFKQSSPSRSHLSRAVRLRSGHLVCRGRSIMYRHGMFCNHDSLQLSSWAGFCWGASHEWGAGTEGAWGPCLERCWRWVSEV